VKAVRFWPWLLLLVPVVLGLARVRFDVEVLNLLPSGSPVVQGLKLYQENFANAREFLLTVRAPDADAAEAAARALAQALRARPDLVAAVHWQPPWLEKPADAAELAAHLWLNQPPEIFAQLTNRLLGAGLTNTLRETREQLAVSLSPDEIARHGYDPLGLLRLPASATAGATGFGAGENLFASADGTFRVLFIEATPDLTTYKACADWLEAIQSVVAAARRAGAVAPEVAIRHTGRPAFVAEIADGMERDIRGAVAGTAVIIAALFWWAHRRWRPLLWLLTLLAVVLGATLALGALVFGTLNVVSLGFAAILLGLSVDYGLVLYQEAREAPRRTLPELRQAVGPGVVWSAITTAGAFLSLNLSALPGLAQLGSLVAIGVALAAATMLYAFLPPLLRQSAGAGAPPVVRTERWARFSSLPAWATTLLVLAVAFGLLPRARPRFDHTAEPLRPRDSAAYAALAELKRNLGQPLDPLWLLVPGRSEAEVARSLDAAQATLARAVNNQLAQDFTLPAALWPRPERQRANRAAAAMLVSHRREIHDATLAHGFTRDSLSLAESALAAWQRAVADTNVFWPTNAASHWVLGKLTARPGFGVKWQVPGFKAGAPSPDFLALGLIYPAPGSARAISDLSFPIPGGSPPVILSGWELLGESVFDQARRDLPRVLGPMAALLVCALALAFRRAIEVALSLICLAFSAVLLGVVMQLAGWSWNLMNLMALPLLLGAGVDYSIHMQLGLRRHGGDVAAVRRTIGRALLLCAGTTVAGFGSLAFSSNAGMASLGQVCAAGIGCAFVTAVFLLPAWWQATAGRRK
jgi:predicted exporter